jgi:hypothetical protein
MKTSWQDTLEQKWAMLRFGEVKVETAGEQYAFEVQAYLGDCQSEFGASRALRRRSLTAEARFGRR